MIRLDHFSAMEIEVLHYISLFTWELLRVNHYIVIFQTTGKKDITILLFQDLLEYKLSINKFIYLSINKFIYLSINCF